MNMGIVGKYKPLCRIASERRTRDEFKSDERWRSGLGHPYFGEIVRINANGTIKVRWNGVKPP
jgi:hypothetical protein